jgi:hypothetical protein
MDLQYIYDDSTSPPTRSALQYGVSPDTVYVSTDEQTLYANLTVTVFNPQTSPVTCQAFQFGFYVGGGDGDLTDNATGIGPAPTTGVWGMSLTPSVDPDNPAVYQFAAPAAGTADYTLEPNGSLVFELNGIQINQAVGTGGTPIVITEVTGADADNPSTVQGEIAITKAQAPFSIENFSVSPPPPIAPGDEVTLDWQLTGADRWLVYDDSGNLLYNSVGSPPPPSQNSYGPIAPLVDTTYELQAWAGEVYAAQSVEVIVRAAQFVYQPAGTPTVVDAGDTVTLSWLTKNASRLTISAPNFQQVVLDAPAGEYDQFPDAPNNQWPVNPVEDTTYTVDIYGPGGSHAQGQVQISVNPPSIAVFNVDPGLYQSGQQVTFVWAAESAVTASLKPDPGQSCGPVETNFVVTPPGSACYELTVSAGSSSATAQTLVVESAVAATTGKFVLGMAYSKSNGLLWVADPVGQQVTRVNAASGTVDGNPISPTFGPPENLVYDWTNDLIWIGYAGSFTLSSIRVADGGQSPYGAQLSFGPYAMAFDGQYVWLADSTSSGDNLVKALGTNPTTQQGPFSIGNQPFSLAFDGQYMWVANRAGSTVDKLQLGNASSVGAPFPLSLPDGPNTIYFDGTYMWVGALYSNTLTKLSLEGAVLATYKTGSRDEGSYPSSMAFDGTYLWVVNGNANSLSVLEVSTGVVRTTPQLTPNLVNLLFDGTYMWLDVIEGTGSDTVGQVFRLSAIFQ